MRKEGIKILKNISSKITRKKKNKRETTAAKQNKIKRKNTNTHTKRKQGKISKAGTV